MAISSPPPASRKIPFLLAALCGLFLSAFAPPTSAAENAPKSFDIPAGAADKTLKQFSAQSGAEVVFGTATAEQVKTNPIKGDFPPREALARMLENTGLIVVANDKTGAFTVSRDPNVERAAPGSDRPSLAPTSLAFLQMHEVEVTGSRIRTLLGEADFSPVLSFTRDDIEHAGVTSIGDLSRLIPQSFSQGSYDGMGIGGQSQGQATTGDGSSTSVTNMRTSFNLRGLGTQNTLVLVDGRRLSRTGTMRNSEGYDLAGIPVSAIERVEVVTDGASAIYGSDALAGVINLVLRKNYSGTELTYSYENTVDSDTAVQTAAFTHGISRGKLSLTLAGSYQDRHAFAAVDRPFTATDNWVSLGGTSTFASFGAGGFAVGAGVVQAASGNLPGLTSASQYAIIPTNSNGTGLTAAQFVPTTATAQLGDRARYVNIISPQHMESGSLRFAYTYRPTLEFFGDARWSRARTEIEGLPVSYRSGITVPANYPGNPFGVAVILDKTFWELGNIGGQRSAIDSHLAASAGVRGDLGHDWRYEAGIDWDRSVLQQSGYDPGLYTDVFNALVAKQALVFFYDSRTQTPNDPAVLRSMLSPNRYKDRTDTLAGSVSADGPLWKLPAGPLRLAVGAEHREETYSVTQFATAQLAPLIVLGNRDRSLDSGYVETRIPVISAANNIPLVNRVDATAAIRYDHYSDAGGDDSPRYGLQWRPVSWLLLRGTRSYAFRAPSIDKLYQPVSPSTNINSAGFIDRQRNELVTGIVNTVNGGNPNLKPEHSISKNIGVVLDAPFKLLKGLSLSVDAVDIDYTDQIATVSTLQEWADLFPERLIRDATGHVTGVDTRSANIARLSIRSFDYQLSYQRQTSLGNFTARVSATEYRKWDAFRIPGVPPVTSLYLRPTRLSWQTYWSKGPYGVGVNGFYSENSWTAANRLFTLFDSAIEWNAQVAYDFGYHESERFGANGNALSRWQMLRQHPLADTKLSLTVFNIFDRDPPHRQGQAGFGVTDPRMLRYVLTLRKKL